MANSILSTNELPHLDAFQKSLTLVNGYIRENTPNEWPELLWLLDVLEDQSVDDLAILPLASCVAVGGSSQEAIPIAAAWKVLNLAIRILDDLEDQDDDTALWTLIGLPRAFNFAGALYALCNKMLVKAPWPPNKYKTINDEFIQATIRLAAGQDRDLHGFTYSLESCWRIMEDKNASAFELACTTGAMCGTTNATLISACRSFGYHLGIIVQLFDDFEGIWEPTRTSDLVRGKITLPIIYGLTTQHNRKEELQQLIMDRDFSSDSNQILEILDSIDTRHFMVWTALRERERALKTLLNCPGKHGVLALTKYMTAMFEHIEDALVVKQELTPISATT